MGQRVPSDAVDETIASLREGDFSDIEDDDDPTESDRVSEEPAIPVIAPSRTGLAYPPRPSHQDVPDVVRQVLESSAREELIGVANFLQKRKKLTLIFHTPIGDVRTRVDWCSNQPDDLLRGDNLMLVKVDSSESTFSPAPGAELDISFAEYAGKARVICLAPPQRLYPGVDLLCFLPQTQPVEKNGRLKDDAPSVVSGKPSDTTDAAGEPVAEGEKSAAIQPTKMDFDKVRDV